MGQTNAKMFFDVYSKWIDGAANALEKSKMEVMLGARLAESAAAEAG